MPSVFITGASRGLGLEFVRQYAGDGWRVFATCRAPEKAAQLRTMTRGTDGKVTAHKLDVTEKLDVAPLARELDGEAIDVLINNAGTYGGSYEIKFGETDYALFETAWRTNTAAPLRIAEAFAEQLGRSAKRTIVNISSRMGSIAENDSGGSYAYRSSKAGLNMVTKSLAVDLKARGVIVVALNPGWVRTDMGGARGRFSPEESVRKMREVIAALSPEDTGRFIDYDGADVPW